METSVKKVYLVGKDKKKMSLLTKVQLQGDKGTQRPTQSGRKEWAGSMNQLPLKRGFTAKKAEATHKGSSLEGESWSLEFIA